MHLCCLIGDTALHWAAVIGSAEVISALGAAGADIEATTGWFRRGETALHLAAQEGHSAAVAQLLELRAAVAPRDAEGNTPLHDAARKGHEEVVQLLRAAKASLDSQNNSGWGPRGDDFEISEWHSQTPLDCARANGKREVMALLEARDAPSAARVQLGPTRAIGPKGVNDGFKDRRQDRVKELIERMNRGAESRRDIVTKCTDPGGTAVLEGRGRKQLQNHKHEKFVVADKIVAGLQVPVVVGGKASYEWWSEDQVKKDKLFDFETFLSTPPKAAPGSISSPWLVGRWRSCEWVVVGDPS
eukprot:Skav214605  [mRNA]  locus=scaffold57:960850:967453:- [translate_table: standard]